MEQSPALSDYAVLISKVFEGIERGETLEKAIDNAIHYCVENGIMRVYLKNDSAEVKRMLSMEWNDEIYREVTLEEGAARATEEIARRMKDKGYSADVVTEMTGISEDEIAKL